MKKRVISILCAAAVLATMLCFGVFTSSADTSKVIEGFKSDEWTKVSGDDLAFMDFNDVTNAVRISNKNGTYSAGKFNFGNDFHVAFSAFMTWDNDNANSHHAVYIGDLTVKIDRTKAAGNSNSGYGIAIVSKGGTELARSASKKFLKNLSTETNEAVVRHYENIKDSDKYFGGRIEVDYASGNLTVKINGATLVNTPVADLDLSNAEVKFSAGGGWQTQTLFDFVLSSDSYVAGSSSEPSSSEPASSEPASSEASSITDSSEAVSSNAVSSEAASSNIDAPQKVTTAISGALAAEDWDPSDKIVEGVLQTGSNANVESVTSVKKYDLGTDWTASIKFSTPTYMGNDAAQPTKLIVGDVEAVAYNSHQTNGTDAYLALNVKGAEVGTFSLGEGSGTRSGNSYGGVLEIKYKDGAITVKHNGESVITYDATADNLDFSAVNFGLALKGNWQNVKNFKITEFAVKTADSYVEPGAPIANVTDGTLNATDWTGDVSNIDDENRFYSKGSANDIKTITTVKAYDLSKGFKFSSTLRFKNSYNNFGGEWASVYVGDPETGLELRIQNQKGQAMYDAYLLVKGEQIATASLLNMPNGKYEIAYKNGKVTVNLEGAAIKWTLNNKSQSTSVAISDVDMTKSSIGLHIRGNWAPKEQRNWVGYSLTSLAGGAGGTGGTTGDARSLIIPAVVIVLGACAAIYVAKNRKVYA